MRCPEFVQCVLFEDLIVELGLSFGVEGETPDLAFGFTTGGHVAIVFGSSGTEFNDVVAWDRRVLGRRRWNRCRNREPADRDDRGLGRDGVWHGRW